MAVLKTSRLKAFTIVETIAALLLVSVSIGVTFLLLASVIIPGKPDPKLKADILLTNLSSQIKFEKRFENRTFNLGDLQIQQEFIEKENYLYLLKFTAIDSKGNVVHTVREYIYYPLQ